jgi:putative transposase
MHLLVDTQGLVLQVKVHGAAVMNREGIEPLLRGVVDRFPGLSQRWLDALQRPG